MKAKQEKGLYFSQADVSNYPGGFCIPSLQDLIHLNAQSILVPSLT
jgi:hypothetical protein